MVRLGTTGRFADAAGLPRRARAFVVDRCRDPADERRVQVVPTQDGWQLREGVAHVPAAIAAAMGLDPRDLFGPEGSPREHALQLDEG